MIDSFDECDFITILQGFFTRNAAICLQHIAHLATEQATLIIFISELYTGFRQQGSDLVIGVINQFAHTLFNQFAGIP
ncbi:Uncharacterised protein [Yersinia enterocolitica]|nr:Uncharacterised protein [Yersinia enterocolitica]